MDGPPTTPFVYRKSFLAFCKEGYREKEDYLYQCTVCPDGRIKNGGWTLKSVIPKTLPPDQMLFEDFPANSNGGNDYIWDGQNLTFDPLPEESEEANAENQD